jgi:hypothetical protein
MREPGKASDGVEVEAIVPARPGPADRSVLFKDLGVDASAMQRGCGRQAGRAGADDYDGGRGQRTILLANTRGW